MNNQFHDYIIFHGGPLSGCLVRRSDTDVLFRQEPDSHDDHEDGESHSWIVATPQGWGFYQPTHEVDEYGFQVWESADREEMGKYREIKRLLAGG